MSYTIERGKRVLFLKTDEKRFSPAMGDMLFFASSSSCNNVSPRHYDWNVIATGHHGDWQGNVLVPDAIWNCGRDADQGGIKPWGKEVSGLGYVKAWKDAIGQRRPIDGWTPRLTIWCGTWGDEAKAKAAEINAAGSALFGYRRNDGRIVPDADLYEAYKRVFPGDVEAGRREGHICSHAELLDALYLCCNRDRLPFSFYLSDHEQSLFMKSNKGFTEAAPAA